MATLAKKIHIRNSAGTEQTVNLYSTTGELGAASGYTFQLVDGVTAYAPLVSTSHAKATSGRVIKGGTTYAWGSTAPAPAYTYKTFTTAGSGTFTVPTGVTKLRVTCVGGGAGGVGGDLRSLPGDLGVSLQQETPTTVNFKNQGTNTTFGSVVANGATAAIIQASVYYVGSARGYTLHSYTESKGTTNGIVKQATSSSYNGASAVAVTNYLGNSIMSCGAGGYGDGSGSLSPTIVCTGASGFKTVSVIDVSPGQVISYSVGAGGNCVMAATLYSYSVNSNGEGGSPGSAGGILVEWGSGIE